MKKTLKMIGVIAGVLVLSACLFACGGGDGDKAADGNKTYLIGTDTTFAPFEYQDENGEYVGVDIELLAAIAENQGFKYELKPLGFDAAVAALESGQVDGVIAGMSITKERQKVYDFSPAYYDSGVVVATKSDAAYESYEDMKGMTLAVKNGTEGAEFAESIKDEYNLTLKYFDESPMMYQEVLSGGVAGCVEDYPVMGYGIKNGNGLKMVGDMVQGSSYGFAVLKGQNAELLEMFNAGLENIKADGTYQEILDKYISEE